jgi:eukaryotic-like serine/threonine-protein kinase
VSSAPPEIASSASWSPPAQIEEYRILRPLGRGAMGQVHLAEDSQLRRLVALKFVEVPSPAARQRFFAEARALARLQHPNVVAVYRVGEVAGRPFLAYEYVRGKSFDRADKPIAAKEAMQIALALARGLAAVHRRGVLHRDIKPANAMISEEGEVKLIDFGVAELLPETAAQAGLPMQPEEPIKRPVSADPQATISLPRSAESAGDAVPSVATQQVGPIARAGTPLYWAPEIWRGEAPTPRADVYALGALLYELCAGHLPHDASDFALLRDRVTSTPAEPLGRAAPGVEAGFAAIVDRCLDRDPTRRFASGEALREAIEQLDARAVGGAVPEGNPYRGLLAFEAEHRGLFFGRGVELRAILERLRFHSFVLVAGDSGVGKSSLCRAGVVPALEETGARVATALLGRHPVAALSAALAPLLNAAEADVAEKLRVDPNEILRAFRAEGDAPPVVFIDQLEELRTLAGDEEAAAAAEILAAMADPSSGIRLLATARTDFLARLSALPGLGEAIVPSLYLLQPLSPAKLREAIVGPARVKGFSFETEAMVDTLVDSAARAGGAMPLLQFALAELWEARDQAARKIPASALDGIGGVAGALARHADEVVQRLLPQQRAAARSVLLRLVTAEGTRARRAEGELAGEHGDPAARAALAALVRGRLLVAREGEAEQESAYEIAHEALLGGWDTLRRWLGEDADLSAVRQRLERAAAEWDRLGRSADALWNERQLAEARRIDVEALGSKERAFFAASRSAARRRRILRWGAIVGGPLIVGLAVAGARYQAARALDRSVAEHESLAAKALETARSKGVEMDARDKAAFALFDAKDGAAGERAWVEARDLEKAADNAFSDTYRELEAGLEIAPSREDVRDRIGDVLYEQAVLCDKHRRFVQRDDLIGRLPAYDRGGTRHRRWTAPTRVEITSSPPGAEVSLEVYEAKSGRRVAGPASSLGATPLGEREIAQGSIVLTFRAPGRATVRLPMLLGRDERLRFAVDLPKAEAIPDGFIYIPPGRFLFGSADEDHWLHERQPIHAVETGAYLIARDEVTMADWIAYLRALPPEERSKRAIHIENLGHLIELVEMPDGVYRFNMRPTTQLYSAIEGEKIHYPGRKQRVDQDWRRFPVAGISSEDATAYAQWLDQTRRLRGARLCDEHEWERAARGADDRLFPHGDRLDPDDANHDVTYDVTQGRNPLGFGLDEVRSHPASVSPFGVYDLAGNVWEWARSMEGDGRPALRGGSWYHRAVDSLSINREPSEPTLRSAFVGLRLCATPGASE